MAQVALIAGGALTFAFLAGQVAGWQQVGPSLYFIQGSPAVAFFYVLTAVHGLHLLGGLYVLGRAALRFAGGAELIDVRLSCRSARCTGISCCWSGWLSSSCCCTCKRDPAPWPMTPPMTPP